MSGFTKEQKAEIKRDTKVFAISTAVYLTSVAALSAVFSFDSVSHWSAPLFFFWMCVVDRKL